MDKIWDRNPSKSEVIGCCGGDKKTAWPRRTGKSQILKKERKERSTVLSNGCMGKSVPLFKSAQSLFIFTLAVVAFQWYKIYYQYIQNNIDNA